jgi:hypothetical protein
MTRYATPEVYPCLGCTECILRHRLKSFNDFGARSWTDGESSIPALSCFSPWIKCPHCLCIFWLADVKPEGVMPKQPNRLGRLGTMWAKLSGDRRGELRVMEEWNALPAAWLRADYAVRPDYFDLEPGLRQAGLSLEREFKLRCALWRESKYFNPAVGIGSSALEVPPDELSSNVNRLIRLYEADRQADRLDLAELLRHAGQFERAMVVAASASVTDSSAVRSEEIVRLAKLADPIVRTIPRPTSRHQNRVW